MSQTAQSITKRSKHRTRHLRTKFVRSLLLTATIAVSATATTSHTPTISQATQNTAQTPLRTTPLTTSHPRHPGAHWFQIGSASWYGPHFQGKTTANGEHFDMNLLTCAHRQLPLGSWVKVTNLLNHKWVIVRVNDRGPMVDDRIVDLSKEAARTLDITGLAKVRLDMVTKDDVKALVMNISALQTPFMAPHLVR